MRRCVHLDGRLDIGTYDTEGIVVVGYTLFALGLAARARRGLAPLGRLAHGRLRRLLRDARVRRLLAPRPARLPVDGDLERGRQPALPLPRDVIISETVVSHEILSGGGFFPATGEADRAGLRNAVFHVVYQPASHYWPLQLTETGLFAGLAVVLIGFAAWWTHQRTA